MPRLSIDAISECWPLRDAFTISRGSKNAANVVVVRVRDGDFNGCGECVPYARYGETVENTLAYIRKLDPNGLDRNSLLHAMPAGAARNAVDCALWDLDAKRQGVAAAALAGLKQPPAPVLTAFTISLDTPEIMATKARAAANLPLLKLKLGGAGDVERLHAVRAARPDARLIADANEAWTPDVLMEMFAAAAETGVETIEQPLPAEADEALRNAALGVPVCADESLRTIDDLARLTGLYDAVNIKLDKAGGLTAALELSRAARARGLKIMIGSMVATSLAIAPALLLTQDADWVDLDGPLLLAQDRDFGTIIDNGVISPADRRLWG